MVKILSSETSKPEDQEKAQSVDVIKQTLDTVNTLQREFSEGRLEHAAFLDKTTELFENSASKLEVLVESSQFTNREALSSIQKTFNDIKDELSKTRIAFEQIEVSPRIINEVSTPDVIVPEIKIPTPVVNTTVKAPDLSKLEQLFGTLPRIFTDLIQELDIFPSDELREDLKVIKTHLKTIAEKEWTANIVGGFGGGGGGGASVQSALTRVGGTAIAVVNPDGTPIQGGGGSSANTPLNEYDENNVLSSSETTILSYTVPVATTAKIQGVIVTAGIAARYKLKVNSVTVAMVKTSASHPTESIDFGSGVISAATGSSVEVTGYHEDSSTCEMAATLFGYIV